MKGMRKVVRTDGDRKGHHYHTRNCLETCILGATELVPAVVYNPIILLDVVHSKRNQNRGFVSCCHDAHTTYMHNGQRNF